MSAEDFSADGFASFDEWWDYQTDCLEYEQRRHDEEIEHWAASQ